jgi:hypothetical protein
MKRWLLPTDLGPFAAAALGLHLAACNPAEYRIAVAPSLRPVDAARPLVIFGQVRGEACGRDAVAGALRDMKRLEPVDGYVEVVVEETGRGDERCARATAYPFRYGTDPELPGLRAGPEPTAPLLVPGRDLPRQAAPGASPDVPFDCARACEHFAELVETGSIKRALAKDRCVQRCAVPDPTFQTCIRQAADSAAATQCLAP